MAADKRAADRELERALFERIVDPHLAEVYSKLVEDALDERSKTGHLARTTILDRRFGKADQREEPQQHTEIRLVFGVVGAVQPPEVIAVQRGGELALVSGDNPSTD